MFRLIEENKANLYKKLDFNNPDAKYIAHQFAKKGHPRDGHAYWKWVAFKYEGNLYIIEWFPVGDKLDYNIKEVYY